MSGLRPRRRHRRTRRPSIGWRGRAFLRWARARRVRRERAPWRKWFPALAALVLLLVAPLLTHA